MTITSSVSGTSIPPVADPEISQRGANANVFAQGGATIQVFVKLGVQIPIFKRKCLC